MKALLFPFWNFEESRVRALWRILLATGFLFVVVVVLTAVVMVVTGAVSSGGDAAQFSTELSLNITTTLFIALAILLCMWVAARLLDRQPMADFGFHLSRNWWRDFLFGLGLGAGLMGAIFLVELAAGWIKVTGTFGTAEPGRPFVMAILSPIVIFICVGIYEECLCRGYWLHNLAEGLNFRFLGSKGAIVLAWVLSSSVFGLMHMGNPNASAISTASLMAAGLFLGLGYVLTGELAVPIGLHIAWNFFQGNVFGFPVSGMPLSGASFILVRQGGPDLWTGGAFGPEAGLMGLAAIIVGSATITWWVWKHEGRLAFSSKLANPRRP